MTKFLLTTVRNNIMNKPNECLGEQEDLNKSFFFCWIQECLMKPRVQQSPHDRFQSQPRKSNNAKVA